MNNILHIYSQEIWHDSAYIVGSKDALIALRDALIALREAIDLALKENISMVSSFTNDGEGFYAFVNLLDEKTLTKLAVPYIDEIAKEKNENAIPPWSLK